MYMAPWAAGMDSPVSFIVNRLSFIVGPLGGHGRAPLRKIPYAVGVEHTIFYCMFSVQLVETL